MRFANEQHAEVPEGVQRLRIEARAQRQAAEQRQARKCLVKSARKASCAACGRDVEVPQTCESRKAASIARTPAIPDAAIPDATSEAQPSQPAPKPWRARSLQHLATGPSIALQQRMSALCACMLRKAECAPREATELLHVSVRQSRAIRAELAQMRQLGQRETQQQGSACCRDMFERERPQTSQTRQHVCELRSKVERGLLGDKKSSWILLGMSEVTEMEGCERRKRDELRRQRHHLQHTCNPTWL